MFPNLLVQQQFEKMLKTGQLYVVNVPGKDLWDLYLNSFKNAKVFRDPESNEHNCNCCRHWFYRYAPIVAIKDNEIISLFDIEVDEEYAPSFEAVRNAIHNSTIGNLFTEDSAFCTKEKGGEFYIFGTPKNIKIYSEEEANKFGVVRPNIAYTFEHYFLRCPKKYVNRRINGKRDDFTVTKRALEEFNTDLYDLVLEFIDQNSIINSTQYVGMLRSMKKLKQEYDQQTNKDIFLWKKLDSIESPRFRNSVIGTLFIELSEGKNMEEAIKAYNYKVDPVNYMKASAPISQKQINEAFKFAKENGYESAFNRRFATMADIEASDIMHMSGESDIKAVSIFDTLVPTNPTTPTNFDKAQSIKIDDFIKNILPKTKNLKVYLTNKLLKNLVALTAPAEKDSKSIFSWSNNFSWTYVNNLTGVSQLAEEVKKAGGVVDAPFRFSIMWNEDGRSIVDLDAHCVTPRGEILYCNKTVDGGRLDVDMINPPTTGVENIYWQDLSTLRDGQYIFAIYNYNGRRNKGAKAELVWQDEVFKFHIKDEIESGHPIKLATLIIKNSQLVESELNTKYLVDSEAVVKTKWGLKTQQFHKVNLMCLSPNYWSDNKGNKHYFFMLEDCKSEDTLRGFHVENLKADLKPHRKVLEILAFKTQIEPDPTKDQLCGLGFNATIADELIVMADNKVIKIVF